MSTNTLLVVVALLLLLKARTTPRCSTTNQREGSFGACSIATGELNVRLGKTGSTFMVTCGTLLVGSESPLLSPHPLGTNAASTAATQVH